MPRGNTSSDRRAFGRRESRIHAFAKVPGRGAEPCIVRNFSDSGALLAFDASFEPPARFRLAVEAKGLDVLCEVRRRDGHEYGVSFVSDDAAGQMLLETTADVPDDLTVADDTPPPRPNALGRDGIVTVVTGAEVRRYLTV